MSATIKAKIKALLSKTTANGCTVAWNCVVSVAMAT